eukprot:TRINITY_DN23997_c0_g1_i1.p1 TRINITY_DN23997_c0_g1~~TRINITY_DN23997_c0_g1_i1.p1  ORF type:complete len:452 (+),score=52.61 TRINITY_DN23997_c0_g1_i1:63-1418(+)
MAVAFAFHLLVVLRIFVGASRVGASRVPGQETGISSCLRQHLCVISANRATNQEFDKLIGACLKDDPKTNIVALGLQDYRDSVHRLPVRVQPEVDGKNGSIFKLREYMFLANGTGAGEVCKGSLLSNKAAASAGAAQGALLGMVGGPKGAALGGLFGGVAGYYGGKRAKKAMKIGCGGVSILVYTLRHEELSLAVTGHVADVPERSDTTKAWNMSSATMTTLKGTVVMNLMVNDRSIIIASTHAPEGVRGKHRGKPRQNYEKMLALEHQRVMYFRRSLRVIQKVADNALETSSGIIWAGDFNSRSVDPRTGMADFGDDDGDGDAYSRLLRNRDYLGAKPEDSEQTTFTQEIALSGLPLEETRFPDGEDCPTYNKAKRTTDKDGHVQFMCKSQLHGDMYYRFDRPPSWVDRIFTNHEAVEWMKPAGGLKRISRDEDHDVVYAQFLIDNPACA